MTEYYSIPTTIGAAKIAAAANVNEELTITHMAFGDANGLPYLPVTRANSTTLLNERHRVAIEYLNIDSANANVYITKARIPAAIGGFEINEIGLFDSDGDLIYLANYPRTFKPQITQGAGGELNVKIHIMTSHSSVLTIVLNPNVITMTQENGDERYALKTELDAEAIARANGYMALAVAMNTMEQSLSSQILSVLPAFLVLHIATSASITLQPYKTIRVFLLGAGGGGGGRTENDAIYSEATDGGDTILRNANTSDVFINAKGGTKGTNSARWGNNSYSGNSGNGVDGVTEVPTDSVKNLIFVMTNEKGEGMLSGQEYQKQAYSQFYGKGKGGAGIAGFTNNPAGGNGAGGAYCEALIYNFTSSPLTLEVLVGSHGLGAHSYDGNSGDGTDGYAVIVLGL